MSENTIARAFEIARSGMCRSVVEIRARLKAEGYEGVEAHLIGADIKKQLLELMIAARANR